ncbi:hypothetical protein [Microbacterium aurantiacum]|uniref:hypothetical protein n=1 Tax=Microbacterium aurantiacum TaxID=162393 RepID=UPI000C80AB3A|nr:hypothetical protein [Microbacterium aurantiacum]
MNARKVLKSALLAGAAYVIVLLILLALGVPLGLNEFLVCAAAVIIGMTVFTFVFRRIISLRKARSSTAQ